MSTAFLTKMWVNDRDLAEFKLMIGDPKGWNSPPASQDNLMAIPGRMGHLRMSGESTVGPRRFTVPAVLRADSQAEAETLWDTFVQLVANDPVRVRFAPWPNRVGLARYEGIDAQDLSGLYSARPFTMSFVMPDPLKYDRYFDVYTIAAATEQAILLGSAPSDAILRIISTGVANPRVLYKDAQGLTRGDISFNLTATQFPAGQYIEYDTYTQIPTRVIYSAGVPLAYADVPEFQPNLLFVLDPDDGDGTNGPTLGPLNCTLAAHVRKAYR